MLLQQIEKEHLQRIRQGRRLRGRERDVPGIASFASTVSAMSLLVHRRDLAAEVRAHESGDRLGPYQYERGVQVVAPDPAEGIVHDQVLAGQCRAEAKIDLDALALSHQGAKAARIGRMRMGSPTLSMELVCTRTLTPRREARSSASSMPAWR